MVASVYKHFDGEEVRNCQGLFTPEAWNMTVEIWNIIFIAIPIALLVLGSADMIRALVMGDPEEINKGWAILGKRVAGAVVTFFAPLIVMFFLNLDPIKKALNLVDDPSCGLVTSDNRPAENYVDTNENEESELAYEETDARHSLRDKEDDSSDDGGSYGKVAV